MLDVSTALNAAFATRVRSWSDTAGIEGLNAKQRHSVAMGNALAEVAAILMLAQLKAGNRFQLEQPVGSIMVAFEPM